jgi:hypothetical protein
MARGSSHEIADDLNLVAARGGDVRGTALADIGDLELDDQQWSALKALVSLFAEHPGETGFDSELIRLTAADLVVSKAERLEPADIDRLLKEMEHAGLVEKTGTAVNADANEIVEGQSGWRPSRAGVQLFGAFMTADWDQATLGD